MADHRHLYLRLAATLLVAVSLGGMSRCVAQGTFSRDFGLGPGGSGYGSSSSAGDVASDAPVELSAQFKPATGEEPAVLMITAHIAKDYHVYSLTQGDEGPLPTEIELAESDQYRQLGPFRSFPEPHLNKIPEDATVWPGVEIQEHADQVTWYAPIELAEGVDPADVTISGMVHGQACKEYCEPVDLPFTARQGSGVEIGPLAFYSAQGGSTESPVAASDEVWVEELRSDDSAVALTGRLEPASVAPGGRATLVLTATPSGDFHVAALEIAPTDALRDPGTMIEVAPPAGITAGKATADRPVVTTDLPAPLDGTLSYYEGPVRWSIPLEIDSQLSPGSYRVDGAMVYRACSDEACDLPRWARFRATLEVEPDSTGGVASVEFQDATQQISGQATGGEGAFSAEANQSPSTPLGGASATREFDLEQVVIGDTGGSVLHYVLLAFVGGIILNLMPCVLPVMGLKVMSFVEQAGQSRTRALVLNLWYAAGIILVFLILAALAILAQFSWGSQFSSTGFNVTLAAIVFAMALSLLGVWEIPIPGLFGGNKAHDLSAKEGPLGAFLKGVITTVLATPCTGPFMASALGWAVRQSPETTLLVFTSLGIGMSSPYLLIGAYPELIRFMPKPGNWMVTFKQLMGFVLMGTVVFLLTFIDQPAVVPTILLLTGISFACWTVSRTPLTAPLKQRMEAWAFGGAITLLAAVVSFGWLYTSVTQPRYESAVAAAAESDAARKLADAVRDLRQAQRAGRLDDRLAQLELASEAVSDEPWQAFTLRKLNQVAVENRKTVLVDFSAEWCLTCKTLEQTVLHTEPVEKAIESGDVVTMYADFTKRPPEIENTIKALESNGVPVIAIFPGNDPYRPIVFRGAYTQQALIDAIEKATGKSLDPIADAASTARVTPVAGASLN